MLPLTKLTPLFPGQWGIPGSSTKLGFRTNTQASVFYVDSTHLRANDLNDGSDPEHPLVTITAAVSKCTASVEDTIIVQPASWAQALETWPITINKANVHLLSAMYDQGVVGTIIPPGDTAGLYITADNVEVAGFTIDAGATHGGIEFRTVAQSWGCVIHDNSFGWEQGCQDGIRMTGPSDKVEFKIYNNRFNDKITRDGIRIEQNATRSEIWNNVFRRVGGVGINLVTLCTDIYAIHDNYFNPLTDAATGQAIFCNANSIGCMFYGNKSMHDMAAHAFVPYRDLGNNHWGLNYAGILAVLPAVI